MKNKLFFAFAIVTIGLSTLTSCNKDNEPANVIAGNYVGSFEGLYEGNDTLTSSGYQVQVTVINDNKVKVFGNDFELFEVLVTTNGPNVEPVTQSDPFLSEFIYIGDEEKIKFTFNKGANEAKFIGIKGE